MSGLDAHAAVLDGRLFAEVCFLLTGTPVREAHAPDVDARVWVLGDKLTLVRRMPGLPDVVSGEWSHPTLLAVAAVAEEVDRLFSSAPDLPAEARWPAVSALTALVVDAAGVYRAELWPALRARQEFLRRTSERGLGPSSTEVVPELRLLDRRCQLAADVVAGSLSRVLDEVEAAEAVLRAPVDVALARVIHLPVPGSGRSVEPASHS